MTKKMSTAEAVEYNQKMIASALQSGKDQLISLAMQDALLTMVSDIAISLDRVANALELRNSVDQNYDFDDI